MKPDVHLDARGLLCPLPVLKARKILIEMAPRSVLAVIASDPAAIVDMPHFCQQAGHRLLAIEGADGGHCYFIERGIDPDD